MKKRQFNFYVTEEEYDYILDQIEFSGMKRSDFILSVIKNNKPIVPQKIYILMIQHIKRIGNNLNQIAKTLNYFKKNQITPDEKLLLDIDREVKSLWQSLKWFVLAENEK